MGQGMASKTILAKRRELVTGREKRREEGVGAEREVWREAVSVPMPVPMSVAVRMRRRSLRKLGGRPWLGVRAGAGGGAERGCIRRRSGVSLRDEYA